MRRLNPFPILSLSLVFCMGTAVLAQEVEQVETLPAPVQEVEAAPPIPVSASIDDEVMDPQSVIHNRQHHVVISESGEFTGRLSSLSKPEGNMVAASGMQVRVIKGGQVVATTTTDADGTFTVSGMTEGVVALFADGPTGLMAYSVRLIKPEEGIAMATPVKIGEVVELGLNSAIVSASDVSLARQLLFAGLPQSDRRFNDEPSESEGEYPFGTNESSTSLFHHQIQLQPDGALVGQVNLLDSRSGRHREVLDLTLHFLRDGEHVAQTDVQKDGSFSIRGLLPGIYSVLTTGEDGILAIGVDLVGATAQLPADSRYRFVSLAQSLDLSVAPVNAENINEQNSEEFFDENEDGTEEGADPGAGPIAGAPGGPLAAPGGGGFTGGGGGGGLGGGGLGGLLGAAAAGAAGYAIGQDDDDGNSSPVR
ncbi:MAG: hypothetical protein NXI04_19595 [Planctomycetaceae bacterium]|nr:hypothetical protein [Planctomycetaceae bacterium]